MAVDPEEHAKQVHELQVQVRFLEDEVALLRRRLTNAPRQVQILEDTVLELRSEVARASAQNAKLADALRSERERLEGLSDEVEKLTRPPASFGVVLGVNDDGTADVANAGRKLRVNVGPDVDPRTLVRGVEVILNDAMNVVDVLTPDRSGEVMTVKERLGEDRLLVVGHGEEERVVTLGERLLLEASVR